MEAFDFSNAFVWRAVERLLAVLIGGGSIYLGFRLFMELPRLSTDGEGKVELPGGISIYVSRVGPGVFFALFGTALVGLSFVSVLDFKWGGSGQETVQLAAAETPAAAVRVSYVSGEVGDTQVSLERETLLRDLRTLRALEQALSESAGGQPFALGQAATVKTLIALPRIKRTMLHSVWDDGWGDYQTFATWVRDGMRTPPPDGLSTVVTDVFIAQE